MIQSSDTVYREVLPVSVEVQKYSDQIYNYLSVIEFEGARKQIVTLYNSTSNEVKQVSSTEIKTQISSTYTKVTTTASGEIVFSSNNVTNLMNKFSDLKFVLNETDKLIPAMNISLVNIAVVPRESVNSYIIETIKGQSKVTVELNYELVSNKSYVISYKEEPIAVKVPIRPVYSPQVLNIDEKIRFIDIIRDSGVKEVKEVINLVESKTVQYALYKETILHVETREGKTYSVKVVQENGKDTPQVIDVSEFTKPEEEKTKDQEITSVKTDSNGNIVTISTDEE